MIFGIDQLEVGESGCFLDQEALWSVVYVIVVTEYLPTGPVNGMCWI